MASIVKCCVGVGVDCLPPKSLLSLCEKVLCYTSINVDILVYVYY